MVSNSSNKIHQTWGQLFSLPCTPSLYASFPHITNYSIGNVGSLLILHGTSGGGNGSGGSSEDEKLEVGPRQFADRHYLAITKLQSSFEEDFMVKGRS